MKTVQPQKSRHTPVQERASSGGAASQLLSASPRQSAQSGLIAQMAGGKKHHAPKGNKANIAKQQWINARQLQLIQGGMSRTDAARQARREWNAAH